MSNIEIKGNAADYLGRIAEAVEGEQAFWDRAFCAAYPTIERSILGHLIGTPPAREMDVAESNAHYVRWHADRTAEIAAQMADAALLARSARRARTEGEQDE